MPYSLDITLTEFKHVSVAVELCSGSSALKGPYVTAVPVYLDAVSYEKPTVGNLYNDAGESVAFVFYDAGSQMRRRRYVQTRIPGWNVDKTDIYLTAVGPQTIPVSQDGTKAFFALPYGAQSKSYNDADDPSRYLVTFFNLGDPDSNGTYYPSVLAQGYLTLPPAVSPNNNTYVNPTICSATVT